MPAQHTLLSKSKAIHVIRREGLQDCDKKLVPHFLHDRQIDGGEVFSLMRRPLFTPKEYSWYSFLLVAESTLGP
jgi:hypothetical protein